MNADNIFKRWSRDDRREYAKLLQENVKEIMRASGNYSEVDFNKPLEVYKTGSDDAFVYSVSYVNKAGVYRGYTFSGSGEYGPGQYGWSPNEFVQELF